MTEPNPDAYRARLAEIRAEKARQLSEQQQNTGSVVAPPPTIFTPASPASIAAVVQPVSETLDDGAKRELRQLPLLDVYIKWFAPESVRQGGGDEVNCSCFNTSFHRGGDRNPQLGFNTAKNTYYCHACGVTGDIVDLAAVYWGFCDANWQCPDSDVHEAVRNAGEELLGMTFRSTSAGWQRVPEYQSVAVLPTTPTLTLGSFVGPAVAPSAMPTLTLGTFSTGMPPAGVVAELPPDLTIPPPLETGIVDTPSNDNILEWRDFVPNHTPLRRYMDITTVDDSPEEYHFWNFLTLIGLILGKDVGLVDTEIVFGNLLVCAVGQTGVGKSRSERHLTKLIQAAIPFDPRSDSSKGVKIITGSGSGEYMMAEFSHSIPDPRANKANKLPDIVHPGVRGLVKWTELSEMIGKSSATGSTVREKVMELYDAAGDVGFGSRTHGTTIVKSPFGSVFTTTQPESIRHLFSMRDSKSGFLNRWIFVSGTRKKLHPRGTPVDTTVMRPEIIKLQAWANEIALHRRSLHDLKPDAADAFIDYITGRLEPLKYTDPLYSRLDLTFKKITLLMSANLMEDAVSVEAVEQAKVVLEYVIRCFERFGAALASTELSDIQQEIIDYLSVRPEGYPGYKIADGLKRKCPDKSATLKALKELEQLGRVHLVPPPPKPGPGRKRAPVYVLDSD